MPVKRQICSFFFFCFFFARHLRSYSFDQYRHNWRWHFFNTWQMKGKKHSRSSSDVLFNLDEIDAPRIFTVAQHFTSSDVSRLRSHEISGETRSETRTRIRRSRTQNDLASEMDPTRWKQSDSSSVEQRVRRSIGRFSRTTTSETGKYDQSETVGKRTHSTSIDLESLDERTFFFGK